MVGTRLCGTNVTSLCSCSLTLIIWTFTEWISVASLFRLMFHICIQLLDTYRYRKNTKYVSASMKSLATSTLPPVLIAQMAINRFQAFKYINSKPVTLAEDPLAHSTSVMTSSSSSVIFLPASTWLHSNFL